MLHIAPVQYSEYLAQLAEMRIQVFREYPYLYEGNLDYEFDYLERYVQCPSAILLALLDSAGQAWGVCTGIPLIHEDPVLSAPIPGNHQSGFYIGEVLILPQARGQGWGAKLLEAIIDLSQKLGFKQHYLYTVVEPAHNRPPHYHSPAKLWRKIGFEPTPIQCSFEWKRWDQEHPQNHTMELWQRS